LNVLDVGCAEGNLGAAIRNMGPNVYGIELFPGAAKEAEKKLNHVLCGDIETVDLPYAHNYFDHITFGDVLEHLHDPWAVLRKVKPYLKSDGSIIACIPNVGHISIIHGLISGNWTYEDMGLLDRTHYRFFTWNEIVKMFHSSGYQITDVEKIYNSNNYYDAFVLYVEMIRSHFQIPNHNFSDEAKVFQYVVEAKKVM
jgi:2-polyprenyl-3-methyl-5-hydroxy-6-metoxy-1,4-benzoquinol methylase